MFDYIDKQCSNLYTYLREIKVCFEIKKKFLTKYLYDKFTMQISKIRYKFSSILEYQYIFKSKKKKIRLKNWRNLLYRSLRNKVRKRKRDTKRERAKIHVLHVQQKMKAFRACCCIVMHCKRSQFRLLILSPFENGVINCF